MMLQKKPPTATGKSNLKLEDLEAFKAQRGRNTDKYCSWEFFSSLGLVRTTGMV